MSTSVAVVVPFMESSPERAVALGWVTKRLEMSGFPVTVGVQETGPWVKACAVQRAVDRVDAEILVIHDADVWCDHLDVAVSALVDHPWAMPHGPVHRLTPAATDQMIAGAAFAGLELEQPPYRGFDGGGIVVIRREDWERCPLDTRFVGWGHEDVSWVVALRCLLGKHFRGRAPLWHLWHPPQRRQNRRLGSAANQKLAKQYRYAARSAVRMAALVDQGRPVHAGGSR